LKYTFIIFFIYLANTTNLIAQTISVVNIQSLINNNIIYNNTLLKIESDREKYLKNFDLKEKELNNLFTDIENSKLILNQSEIIVQLENYNIKLDNFTKLVNEFNLHYQNQINDIREVIFEEILKLLELYAVENSIDLILDSSTYLIASNTLDITNDIQSILEKLNLKLEYQNFEKN
tara:strand:- start:1682 stop:2212 length:531 start_codon:yes stop_codon:yes gene_type:complete